MGLRLRSSDFAPLIEEEFHHLPRPAGGDLQQRRSAVRMQLFQVDLADVEEESQGVDVTAGGSVHQGRYMRIVHGVDIGRLAVRESCVRAVLEQEFFAASTCPPTDAVMSADMPSDRTLLASTSFFRSDFMTLDRPSPAANKSA